jgi:hypothetical protein
MSRSTSNKRQSAGPGPGRTAPPARRGNGSIRSGTLLLLVLVVIATALLSVISAAQFVIHPAADVRAGPMYVTLALTTGAAMLMAIMALNASFLPIMSAQRAANVHLVMWSMGLTGVVTGILTVGSAAGPVVTRLVLGGLAFVFITTQNSRLARARARARAGLPATPAGGAPGGRSPAPARPAPAHASSRQRRGGRKR